LSVSIPVVIPFSMPLSVKSRVVLFNSLFVLFAGAMVDAAALTIPTVVVDHPGYGEDGDAQFAEVNYTYRIGQYEVTCAEYAAFLNAVATDADPHGLYHPEMETAGIRRIENDCGSDWGTEDCPNFSFTVIEGWEQKPVTWVSLWDAARFANWLTHDQPVGPCGPETTEDGMYPLTDGESLAIPVVRSREAWNSGGIALATVDEWFKAAQYDPGKGVNGGLWSYPTMSDAEPLATAPNDTLPNSANFNNAVGGVTEVGAYALGRSTFGTFDQMGNVKEWLESLIDRQIQPGVWVWQRIAAGSGYASSDSVP
jgi:formylglycine-generating enzyme required for sulfatase activity